MAIGVTAISTSATERGNPNPIQLAAAARRQWDTLHRETPAEGVQATWTTS